MCGYYVLCTQALSIFLSRIFERKRYSPKLIFRILKEIFTNQDNIEGGAGLGNLGLNNLSTYLQKYHQAHLIAS